MFCAPVVLKGIIKNSVYLLVTAALLKYMGANDNKTTFLNWNKSLNRKCCINPETVIRKGVFEWWSPATREIINFSGLFISVYRSLTWKSLRTAEQRNGQDILLAQLAAIFSVTCRCRQSFIVSPAVSSMYCIVGQLGFILLTILETTVVQLDLTSSNTTPQTLNKQRRRLSTLVAAFTGRKPATFS